MEKSSLIRRIEAYALECARADKRGCTLRELPVEYIFVAMLKFADPSTFSREQLEKLPGEQKKEIWDLRGLVESLELTVKRTVIRRACPEPGEQAGQFRADVQELAEEACQMNGARVLTADAYLKAICSCSSEVLDGFLHTQGDDAELQKLLDLSQRKQTMKQNLLQKVIGQEEAVAAFVDGVMASVFLETDRITSRPRGIFVFAGPPGVGKTFLAETAAQEMNLPVKRFDMSEYVDDEDSLAMLIGSDPVWKGSHEGELTAFVEGCNARGEGCFLIFDEIEKAHPAVIHLFLQILDAGRLTDKKTGRSVFFRDAYIVFTTNAGRSLYKDGLQVPRNLSKAQIIDALRQDKDPQKNISYFPEAILSRFRSGYTVMFRHLSANELVAIGTQEMEKNTARFRQNYGVEVTVDKDIPFLLLLKMGGTCDARAFRAECERFVREHLLTLGEIVNPYQLKAILRRRNRIRFTVNSRSRQELNRLIQSQEEEKTLLVISEDPGMLGVFESSMEEYLSEYRCIPADAYDSARTALERGTVYPTAILINMPARAAGGKETEYIADQAPLQAFAYSGTREFLRWLRDEMEEIPVYILLDRVQHPVENLSRDLVKNGAADVVFFDEEYAFLETLYQKIRRDAQMRYLPDTAFRFARERKGLTFTVTPGKEQAELLIRMGDFQVVTLASGEDMEYMVKQDGHDPVTFDDYIGGEAIKAEMRDFIRFLRNPRAYRAKGNEEPRGVLLYGPPGTGKTFFARATANEAKVPFFAVNGSSFISKYSGSGPEMVRELFAKARRYAPAIVFIDELDAIGRQRSGSVSMKEEEETLNMLLSEMDGFEADRKRPVFVIGATNYGIDPNSPMSIDPAIVRRFTRTVYVDLPNQKERLDYFRTRLREYPHRISDDFFDSVAGRSVGMNYGNINNVISKAHREAQRTGSVITEAILDDALETVLFGEKRDWGKVHMERTAWHEAGHAFVSWKCGRLPAYITITSRGNFGGYVMHADTEDKLVWTKREILDQVRIALAGRAAEILRYGREEGLTTGASQDIRQAGKLLTDYVCRYGMDEKLGLIYQSEQEPLSAQASSRVHELLETLLADVLEQLRKERPTMERFVDRLLKDNKLMSYEMREVFEEVEAD